MLVTSSVDVIVASRRELKPTPRLVVMAQYMGAFTKYVITVVSIAIQLFSVGQLTTCSYDGLSNSELQNLCNVTLPTSQYFILTFLAAALVYGAVFVVSAVVVSRGLALRSARTIALSIVVLGTMMVVVQVLAATVAMGQSLRFGCQSPLSYAGGNNGQSLYRGECTAYHPVFRNATVSLTVPCETACTVRPGTEIFLLCASVLLTHVFVIFDLVTYYNRSRTADRAAASPTALATGRDETELMERRSLRVGGGADDGSGGEAGAHLRERLLPVSDDHV